MCLAASDVIRGRLFLIVDVWAWPLLEVALFKWASVSLLEAVTVHCCILQS
jgi:hypothetical protein